MKKIDREACYNSVYKKDKNGVMWMDAVESDVYCKVKKSDLDALEAELEKQKWISVEDILPEHEEAVDIYHKDLCRVPDCIYIDPSNYDGVGEKHFFTGKICIYLEDVTHWRKIPDNPPQEKE